MSTDTVLDFELKPINAPLGATVHGIDLRQLNDVTFKRHYELWLHHLLLVFKGQDLSAGDLVTLIRRFGTPVTSSIRR